MPGSPWDMILERVPSVSFIRTVKMKVGHQEAIDPLLLGSLALLGAV